MTWLSGVGTVFYYCSLPVTTLIWLILIPLTPLLHIVGYVIAGCLWPFTLLAKLETLYIYLGVAAVVGLCMGFILHIFSALLAKLFNLNAMPEDKGRTAASIRAQKEREKLEQRRHNAAFNDENSSRKYDEWLDQNTTWRVDGLPGQTILEEDDDSENGF